MQNLPNSKHSISLPPLVIESNRVIQYAIVTKDVRYTGKQRLYVGDKLLGRVPRIAICKSLQSNMNDYLILFCSKNWRILGLSGAETLRAAKTEVERHYIGLATKWVTTNTSPAKARQWFAKKYPTEVCNFCRKSSYEVSVMFPAPYASICSSCVEVFAMEIKNTI
jgi:hypothetical protein